MPNDNVLELAQAKIKDPNTDNSFKIKIERKVANTLSLISAVEGATIDHVASPESWVPALVGGGQLFLRIYHEKEPGLPIGGGIALNIGNVAPHEADLSVTKRPTWVGPPIITFPAVEDQKKDPIPSHMNVLSPGGMTGTAPPLVQADPLGATLNPAQWNAHVASVAQAQMLLQQAQAREQSMTNVLQQTQLALANATKAIEDLRVQRDEDRRALESKLNEERQSRKDTEAKREREAEASERDRRHEKEMAELRAQVLEGRKGDSSAGSWEKLITALVPIGQSLLQYQQDTRLKLMELDAKRAEQFQAFMANAMQQRGMDPAVQAALDMVRSTVDKLQSTMEATRREDPTSALLPRMTEAFSFVMDITTNAMRASAEAGNQGGHQESPWIAAIGEIGKALAEVMKGVEIKVGSGAAPSAPQLPGAAYENAARTGAPPPPMQPPQPLPPAPRPAPTVMDNIDAMVKAKTDPDSIAANFVRELTTGGPNGDGDESVNKVVSEVGGDFNKLIGRWRNVDQKWVHDKLMPALNREGEKAGIFGGRGEDSGEGGSGNSGGSAPPLPAAPPAA